jgi:myo-inositol 2-dehydrogenase/D-chiro-inositol 1-dehydrogenase
MMIHDFDMVRYLSGSEVTEVFANGAVLVDPSIGEAGDIDTAIVTLKFAKRGHRRHQQQPQSRILL